MFSAEIEEKTFDCGVSHGAESVAVVQYLVVVFSLWLTSLVVDDPHAFGAEDNAVGSDNLVVPGDVAFVF